MFCSCTSKEICLASADVCDGLWITRTSELDGVAVFFFSGWQNKEEKVSGCTHVAHTHPGKSSLKVIFCC